YAAFDNAGVIHAGECCRSRAGNGAGEDSLLCIRRDPGVRDQPERVSRWFLRTRCIGIREPPHVAAGEAASTLRYGQVAVVLRKPQGTEGTVLFLRSL